MDLGLLDIDSIIVHDVPRRMAGQTGPSPVLSEIESPADAGLRNFIRERVIGTLKGRSFEVVDDPASTSPIPGLLRGQVVATPRSPFVPMTQSVAQHLHQVQTGANPAGLLVVLRGDLDRHALGIMKLEREEAIRLNQLDLAGKRTFELEHLADLMLNKKTRVFKTGLFWAAGGEIHGYVSDMQLGADLARAVANFFLHSFLGCKLLDDPATQTKRFWDTTEQFVNEQVSEPEQQNQYMIALTAEMRSQAGDVNPKAFAATHIDQGHRDAFRATMNQAGLDSIIVKDVNRIESKLRRIEFEFASGLRLSGPADVVEDRVTVEETEDGTTHVEFTDKLTRLRGKGM